MGLQNLKIRIISPEISEAVQKAAFEMGYSWSVGGEIIKHYREHSLYMHSYGGITQLPNNVLGKGRCFKNHVYPEITVEDFLLSTPIKWDTKAVSEWIEDVLKASPRGSCLWFHDAEHTLKIPVYVWKTAVKSNKAFKKVGRYGVKL